MTNDMDHPVLKNFHFQAKYCAALGSPLCVSLLAGLAQNFEAKGPVHALTKDWPDTVTEDAVALRLLGGLHRLVLDGKAQELAAFYPSSGGTFTGQALDTEVNKTVETHQDFLATYLRLPPQTNEVRRSAALHGGFLTVAAETGLPLNLLEIGSSAGLNLLWDHYRFRNDAYTWGAATSPVEIDTDWEGPPPPITSDVEVIKLAGCDLSPIDVLNTDDQMRLLSYIWSDQKERFERIRAAIGIAQELQTRVDKADAEMWLKAELGSRPSDACTVIFHSIFWQYMPQAKQAAIRDLIQDTGQDTTASAPLAWLRMEPDVLTDYPRIRLTLWPTGDDRILGTTHFHGAWVKWGEAGQAAIGAKV